ncbi:MAG: hypothetical protein COB66_08855 [Coxiella sp. (in: Bacteria)]|nr:MAG: hypothetical protein COB66_08855 [Coxiella sp. (in: g-proteobacteria)]
MEPIKLLIVDDNEDDRILYKRLLLKKYKNVYTITEANNGEEGLAACKTTPPDCVLLDYNMPDMNGLEWVDKITADPQCAAIPMVMLTGQGSEKLAALAIQKGVFDYAVKANLMAEELHHIIGNTIEKARLLDQVDAQRNELEKMAHHDHLTGLDNRFSFEKALNLEIKRAKRHNLLFAVLFLDLDDFKKVNDEFGHDIGDLLLNEASSRLTYSIRDNDSIARFGGDEFAIILENINHARYAGVIASKIIQSLETKYIIENKELSVKASIGIACYPLAGKTTTSLLKSADMAMYHAKNSGKSCFKYYTESLNDKFQKKMQLERLSHDAIVNDECYLLYQPIYELATQQIVAVESLIRWNHPDFGTIEPDEFIPIAEETGAIDPIGQWALRQALQQYSEWMANHSDHPLQITINVSPIQLLDNTFIELLNYLLKKFKLDPSHVAIELTETAIMKSDGIIDNLRHIHSLGMKIAVDDFGTGFSSLRHLYELPIDIIKIDISIISKVTMDDTMVKMVKSIISIAQHFGLDVIAEGVETEEQLHFLKEASCTYAQGFYFSKPLPPNEIAKLL